MLRSLKLPALAWHSSVVHSPQASICTSSPGHSASCGAAGTANIANICNMAQILRSTVWDEQVMQQLQLLP